jgi:hypothetical protein
MDCFGDFEASVTAEGGWGKIRLAAHWNLGLLRLLCYSWMEMESLLRLRRAGTALLPLFKELFLDTSIVCVAGIIIPLFINVEIEVQPLAGGPKGRRRP